MYQFLLNFSKNLFGVQVQYKMLPIWENLILWLINIIRHWFNFGVPDQNGIWTWKSYVCPKNDDEKWPRKNVLKFRHAQSLFWKIFFTSWKGGFLHQIANLVPSLRIFQLLVVYLHIILNECLSYKFHTCSILTGHTKLESVAY